MRAHHCTRSLTVRHLSSKSAAKEIDVSEFIIIAFLELFYLTLHSISFITGFD